MSTSDLKNSRNAKMVEILRRLKPEMNGAVVGEMERRGVRYGLNYGVAVPVVRRVAREYAPDPALAEYLFRQDVRELKLAAIYVDDPRQVTAAQMNRWADTMPADELMEHAAMNLFHASPEAETVIDEWLTGEDRLRWKGALHMIGRRASTGSTRWGRRIEELLSENKPLPVRAAVYALYKSGEASENARNDILAITKRLSRSENPYAVEIADEATALLDG